jgi:hypothetical protein
LRREHPEAWRIRYRRHDIENLKEVGYDKGERRAYIKIKSLKIKQILLKIP